MTDPIDSEDIGRRLNLVIERAMAELKDIGLTHADCCRFLGMRAVFAAGEDLEALATIQREATMAIEAYSTSEGETLR